MKGVIFSNSKLSDKLGIWDIKGRPREAKKILRTPSQDRAARQKIREEIDHTKSVIERDWLLGKVG